VARSRVPCAVAESEHVAAGFVLGGVEDAVDAVGDRFVALCRRVLVAQRRSRARVAEPMHQFLRARSGRCCHGAGDVAQVVQPHTLGNQKRIPYDALMRWVDSQLDPPAA
jgi:hypothetical protein